MEGDLHLVEFDKWCKRCKYEKTNSNDEPCDTCLEFTARPDSRRPERWEEKK